MLMNGDKSQESRLRHLTAENERLARENKDLSRCCEWVDLVTDAVATAEPEMLILRSWNKAAEKLYGFTEEEVLGRTIADVTRRNYIGITRDDAIASVRANGHWEGEVQDFHKNGTLLNILTSVTAIKNSEGGIDHYLAINRDISTIRRIEEYTDCQRRAFQVIAEAAVSAETRDELCRMVLNDLIRTLKFDIGSIRLLDEDKRTLIAVAVAGIEKEKIPRMAPPQDIDDTHYFAPWVVRNRTAIFAPDAYHHAVAESHGDRLRELGIRALISWPIIDSDNELIGVMQLTGRSPREINKADRSFFTTVTSLFASLLNRKQMEDALRISEENYRSIFNNIQDVFFRVGLDGRLQMLNPSGLKMLGWDNPEEIIGTPVAETVYYDPQDRLKYVELLNRDGFLKDMDIPLKRKDGTRIMAEINAYFRYDSAGNRIAMEGILRDVRQRKKLEQELLKAQRMESIGLLAGGIAHDFNNILTAIMGNISLARSFLDPKSQAANRLSHAEDACIRARDINQQLLTFSKGGKPLRQLSDVARLIRQTVDFSLRGSHIKCEIRIPEDLYPAEIDEGQISQAIHNLIINSIQAMPDGGLLRVTVQNISGNKKNGNLPDPYIQVLVEDSGIGMDAETVTKAFDPFFTTKSNGSGLGLTTVFSIVQNHGGKISIKSEPQKGTTVTILIPAKPGHAPVFRDPDQFIGRINGRLLMMDDDHAILEMAQTLCGEIGIDLVKVSDGIEAIEHYVAALESDNRFDLVIIDLTIPGSLGGLETIKRLITIDPDVRAIVSSGYSNDAVMSAYRDHGFIACLRKPYRIHDLYRTFAEHMKPAKKQ